MTSTEPKVLTRKSPALDTIARKQMGSTAAYRLAVATNILMTCLSCHIVDAFHSRTTDSTRTPLMKRYENNLQHRMHHWQDISSSVIVSASKSEGSASSSRQSRSKQSDGNRNRKKRGRSSNNGGSSGSSDETWRIFGIEVHPDRLGQNAVSPMEGRSKRRTRNAIAQDDEGSIISPERAYLTRPVLNALLAKLRVKKGNDDTYTDGEDDVEAPISVLPKELKSVRVVRRSLDARRKRRGGADGGGSGPRYNYVVDVEVSSSMAKKLRLKQKPGLMERTSSLSKNDSASKAGLQLSDDEMTDDESSNEKPVVAIVGAGPAGLFCALTLARDGHCRPILFERGQPVESRGRDIGALMHRRSIDSESNFAFGEGGAGTWSDGKLTTRIGRNQGPVRSVLETLVEYGAPEKILIDGAPHLGTDNLVRLLRNMRRDLRKLGGEIRFGARMTRLFVEDGIVSGLEVEYNKAVERSIGGAEVGQVYKGTERIDADAVVLAAGHSARDVYEQLHELGISLEAKGFATGFRVEHPQRIINRIQYGEEWGPSVVTGRSATDEVNKKFFDTLHEQDSSDNDTDSHHDGRLPVASYRLATDKAFDGESVRGAYSFCMCPGGQIVPASTDPEEVCVNGMSFSKRDSVWANSALVVTVSPDDPVLTEYREKHGVLAGIEFQRDMERAASAMGGGNLTVPVQRLTDFVEGVPSTSAPSSSYRLGVKPSACHAIYPEPLVNSLRDALVNHFEKKMPGYICEEGLLHAVETRTSSPVRVSRDVESYQAVGCKRLFPAGEGAGFAGGIVSAAVDGMMVADAVIEEFGFKAGSGSVEQTKNTSSKRKKASVGFEY